MPMIEAKAPSFMAIAGEGLTPFESARLIAASPDLDVIEATIAARESRPISVPVTSIYSKRDGVVGWQASIDRHTPQAEHFEVRATHLGLGISPDVLKILARKLAQA